MNLAQEVYKSGMTEQEFISALYYEATVRIGMMHNSGASREQIISGEKGKVIPLLKHIKEGMRVPVDTMLNAIYQARRFADIDEGREGIKGLKTAMNARYDFGTKKTEGNWNFRIPRGVKTNTPTAERLIVNARPDAEIIKKLDDFCRQHKCYYKIPNPDEFSTRVDTVVVYAQEILSNDTKTEFAEMMSPYVRKERTNDLDGEKLADGVFWAAETSKPDDITAFIGQFSSEMQPDIKSYLTTAKGELKMSLGQRKVLEEFAAVLEDIKQNQSERPDMGNTVYDSFVEAYKKANGNVDKIDMSKMPDEIQKMFADNDYKKQIELFKYCCDNTQTDDKLLRKTKNYANNLQTLQKVITSQDILKKQIERDQAWFKEDPKKREKWRKGLEAFFKERQEKETDPVRKKRIASYLDFLSYPVNFDVNTIENDSRPDNSNEPVIFSNSENANSGSNNNSQGQDFEEPDNDKIPAQVKKIKEAFSANGIAIRATKEGQEDYPFSYNLYEKGKIPGEEGVKPTGKLDVVQEDKVVLDSKDVRHFVAAMNGLRKSGKDEIKLELKGDNEDAKKAFAANAIVAGMITGVKVTDCPYQLEDLKAINPLIEKVMELKSKQDAISKTAEKVENGETQQEAALETQITEAFESYKQISKDLLPPKEQLHIFECGAKAVEKTKTRNIALSVVKSMKNKQH